jgi:hypothetical protein
VQSTAIDKEAGLIRLHTALVHSSGEWLASELPVCPVSDAGSPQRIGAALTYARRYALFALVGIAGEDDWDAPGLNACSPQTNRPVGADGQRKPQQPVAEHPKALGRRARAQEPKRPLQSQLSAVLRSRLLEELTAIGSADEVVAWAQRRLEAKNTLTLPDANLVEQAFRKKMSIFEAPTGAASPNLDGTAQAEQLDQQGDQNSLSSEAGWPRKSAATSRAPKRVALWIPNRRHHF